jgi:hypothetical protein
MLLTERCRNYSQIHCEWAQKSYGNKSCSGTTGNHGHREETLNFTKDGDGKNVEAAGMCDAFQLPSPQKKQKTVKEQPYEIFKPRFDEFISL